jgi:biopolymer transport protein ExbB
MISLAEASQQLAADLVPQALENTWKFFTDGGVFMGLIVGCSMVALAVILYKLITLTMATVLPNRLAGEVERYESYLAEGTPGQLQNEFREGETVLARLCAVATKTAGRPQSEVQNAVQASAREEVVKMQSGLPILDVVITVAPLLGLLGTASGLVLIFGNTEDLVSGANNKIIGAGIARALGTTIAGLVVAVPSVVAHSYFTRKIETMAARLEVLLGIVISAGQHVLRNVEEVPVGDEGQPAPPQLSKMPQ